MSDSSNKTNRGVLFRNDNRESDRHPEFTGTVNVEGKEYRIAAWVNESHKTGRKYFSLAISPKSEQQQKAAPAPQDPDVPF